MPAGSWLQAAAKTLRHTLAHTCVRFLKKLACSELGTGTVYLVRCPNHHHPSPEGLLQVRSAHVSSLVPEANRMLIPRAAAFMNSMFTRSM